MNQMKTARRILRIAHVQAATGLGRTAIYDLIKRGLFPEAKPLADLHAVGWDSLAVEAWISQQLDAQ